MIENQWYAILPSRSLRKGKLLGVRRMGLDLVLFRDGAGNAGCVVDQCTHRGAALSKGKLKGDCVSCPFHAIEFDRNGACSFIPANGKASREDLSRYDVRHYPVREAHGIIYLWYGDASLADLSAPLPFFGDVIADGCVYSEFPDLWNAHYSRAIENQLDVVHVPIVHYNTIGRGNKTLINGPKVVWENGTLRTSANNERDEGQAPRKPDECEIRPTHLDFRFPNVWLNHISPKIQVLIFFAPVDGENTILYIRFYCRLTGIRPIDSLIAFIGKFMNRVIERQDKRVVVTQKPKASELKGGERLIAGDGPIVAYRKIRDQLKRGETPAP